MSVLPEPAAVERELLEVHRQDIHCRRDGDELVLDTPLPLQNGALLRVYISAVAGGGLSVSDGGYVAGEIESFTRTISARRERQQKLERIARRLNLDWESEFRAYAPDLPTAMRRVVFICQAVDQALSLDTYRPPRPAAPIRERLFAAFKLRGLHVHSRRRLPVGDNQDVVIDYEVRRDGRVGAVELLTSKSASGAKGVVDRAVTVLHLLSRGGYPGRLFAVFDEESPIAQARNLDRFRKAKPELALLLPSHQAATAIPELLGA